MLRAFSLSLAQLGDPAILRILAKSLALTLLIFAAGGTLLYMGLVWAIGRTGWENGGLAAAAGAVALALVSGWLWWRAVAIGVIGLFADQVAATVESRYYPAEASTALAPPAGVQLRQALSSVGRAIAGNLLALPVYLLLLATGIGAPLVFVIVNALLLSRDLGEMIGLRRVPWEMRHDWLRRTRAKRLRLGAVSAVLFVIPVVNLLAPILSAAMAAHMLHEGKPQNA